MRLGLVAAGLLGLASIAASAPPTPQNEHGDCVTRGVQDRFREAGPAEALAAEIVATCIPERRQGGEGDPERRAYFDRRYAEERAGALTMSVFRIERFRRNAAAAPPSGGQPTLTLAAAEQILRMASLHWQRPMRVAETRLVRPPRGKTVLNGDWERLAVRLVIVSAADGGRYATYYVDSAGRVTALFLNSSPYPQCRPFAAGETLAVEAVLIAVPAASAAEIGRVRTSVGAGWSPPYLRIPARVGPYVFLASRAGPSAEGRRACHDHLSLTLAPAG